MSASGPHSTQDHLPIAGIQDSVVLMGDGSVRAVLKADPINFELKSEEEQNAIIYSYQSFLNSLPFPIQIVIQSKKLDLEPYLHKMEEGTDKVTSDLLRIQITDYAGFVRQLISVANIMSKKFYVVVGHSESATRGNPFQLSSIIHRKPTGPLMDQTQFDHLRAELMNRAGIIAGGLGRFGCKSQLLQTQELIELYYGIYNPEVAAEERLTAISALSSGVVTSLEAEHLVPQQDLDRAIRAIKEDLDMEDAAQAASPEQPAAEQQPPAQQPPVS